MDAKWFLEQIRAAALTCIWAAAAENAADGEDSGLHWVLGAVLLLQMIRTVSAMIGNLL